MRVVCAGGGTLGSVTPLLAVLEELRPGRTLEVDWFGTALGPERALVETAGWRFHVLSAGKLRRYQSLQNFTDLARIVVGFFQALKWFGTHEVDVVITAGAFVAVPVAWAAWCVGVPVFVHQQDVLPGLANKLMAPVAKRVTVSLKGSLNDFPQDKVAYTGNPVRRSFFGVPDAPAARRSLGLAPDAPTLLVLGGGTGAQFFNDLVVQLLPQLVGAAQVIHITGAGRAAGSQPNPRYLAMPFTTDTSTVLAAADVVLTRAGMGTITELAAFKRAAIVVPIPQSHQEDNAHLLEQGKAALVLPQAGLTPEHLLGTVGQLLEHPSERAQLGSKLAELFPPGAATRVAQEILSVVKH